jgi:hypothetical protein
MIVSTNTKELPFIAARGFKPIGWATADQLICLAYADCIFDEIEHYLKSDISCDDVLRFWESSSDISLSKSLPRTALKIPATPPSVNRCCQQEI